MININVISN